jgi:uncharacterized protein (TIGR02217 family)
MTLPVFPSLPGQDISIKRTARWTGTSQEALSGKRVRVTYASYPTYAYELKFNFLRAGAGYVITATEYQQLAAFINALYGGAGMFLFSDPNDNAVSAQSIGLGTGTATTYQLVRAQAGGSFSFVEPVFFPNVITNVQINGVSTSSYTLSATGAVIFNTAPALGATLTWTGTFYWGCRLDGDAWDFEQFMTQLFKLGSLKFSTEKLV